MDPTAQNLRTAIDEFEKAHSGDPNYQEVCDLLKGALDSIDPQGPDVGQQPTPGHQAAQAVAHKGSPPPPPQHSPGHQAAQAAAHQAGQPPAFAQKAAPNQPPQDQQPPKGFSQAQQQALDRFKKKPKQAA